MVERHVLRKRVREGKAADVLWLGSSVHCVLCTVLYPPSLKIYEVDIVTPQEESIGRDSEFRSTSICVRPHIVSPSGRQVESKPHPTPTLCTLLLSFSRAAATRRFRCPLLRSFITAAHTAAPLHLHHRPPTPHPPL